jgi:hypothetical protein
MLLFGTVLFGVGMLLFGTVLFGVGMLLFGTVLFGVGLHHLVATGTCSSTGYSSS